MKTWDNDCDLGMQDSLQVQRHPQDPSCREGHQIARGSSCQSRCQAGRARCFLDVSDGFLRMCLGKSEVKKITPNKSTQSIFTYIQSGDFWGKCLSYTSGYQMWYIPLYTPDVHLNKENC